MRDLTCASAGRGPVGRGLGVDRLGALFLGALLLDGCRAAETSTLEPPVPTTLLARVLDELAATPEIGAHVAAGAIAHTSTQALAEVGARAMAWASESRARQALERVTAALVRRGQAERVEVWAASLEPRRLEPIQMAVIQARTEAGDVEGAVRTIAELRDPERADEARVLVIRAHARRGRWRQALPLLEQLADRRHRDEALAAVAEAHARGGRWREAKDAIASIESSFHRAGAQAAVARAEYRRGRRTRALKLAKLLESEVIQTGLYGELGATEARKGRGRAASRLFDRARASAAEIDDDLLRADALVDLALTLQAVGRHRAAEAILGKLPPDRAAEVRADRVRTYVRRGELTKAQRSLAELEVASGSVVGEAMRAVCALEARRGQLDSALERTSTIAVPAVRWRTLGEVAAIQASAPLTPERWALVVQALRRLP